MSARRVAFVVATTLALTFAFVVRVRGEWVWDDVYLVQQNPQLVMKGGLWSILTRDLWGGATGATTQLYHPIPVALLWLEAQVFGVSLTAMRLCNVVLHALNGALLFTFARKKHGFGELAAEAVTVVFLLHPSSTEPVMWVTGSHDLAGVAFTLLAFLAVPRWWLAAIFAGAAFLSKELYVVVPMLLLVEPICARKLRPAVLLPLAALVPVFLLRSRLGIPTASDAAHAPLGDLVRCAGAVLVRYGIQIATFRNGMTTETYVPLALAPAIVLVVTFAAVVVLLSWRKSRATLPFVWFCLALAPNVLALPAIGMFANRYAYLPSIGFALLIGGAIAALERYLAQREDHRVLALVAYGPALAALILALSTAGEASQWASGVALFGADVDRAPDDPHALYHFGHAVWRRQGCREALPFYERAVIADPRYQRAWHNIAGCLINERRYDEAVRAGEHALALAPDDARAESTWASRWARAVARAKRCPISTGPVDWPQKRATSTRRGSARRRARMQTPARRSVRENLAT